MSINRQGVSEQLIQFNFKHLFIEELGWDKPPLGDFTVEIKDDSFRLTNIAEKRGVQVFVCTSIVDTDYPDNITRRKIETKIRKIAHEHLIIFIDNEKTIQRWQWVYRKPGQPAQYREHKFEPGHGSEALLQKLGEIEINIEDEESLRLLDVALKLKDAFDKDKVTKKFYDHFKKQQKTFREFIEGIPIEHDRHWYSAVMLNRMMFIYFIQKKGFLNDDSNYLKSKLVESKERIGSDKYYTFYRNFLRRLFHEGLDGKEPRSNELNDLLGKIPYLNGGLFDEHELEKEYPHIKITDEAFEKLFDFFDQYEWHLDNRPIAKGNEINPEVLGYIFEKFINKKEMGAYYTKEDITEYISKNTIIPFLFDQAKEKCKIAFEGDRSVWDLLKDDPDRYFYDAVKKGIPLTLESIPMDRDGVPTRLIQSKTMDQIPENITIGLETNKPDLLDRRKDWNTKTPEEFALPTEIWRETIARWQRYFEVRQKIENGEIQSINDLITYNLNIRQFAQDVIEIWEGPELIRAFYKAITKITVLDPTVGSGAFLFAALNILEPLYEACIIRMEQFVEDLSPDAPKSKFSDFKNIISKIDQHPSRSYFIYKTIIINNLYGVDIMGEAVEICKLRLFLKLVAQIDNVNQIEPLPDIDFNIRAGNTLVGFATSEEVRNALVGKKTIDVFTGDPYDEIKEKAEDVQALYDVFLLAQMEEDDSAADFKTELRNKLNALNETLNHTLAGEYGIDHNDNDKYQNWLITHKPFHWFVEFYGILNPPSKGVDSDDRRKTGDAGGFDVIIGNPPYVEYSKVKKEYTILNYKTESCGNLYAFCCERSIRLLRDHGKFCFIIPISSVSTPRMNELMKYIEEKSLVHYSSNFAVRPGKLFTGADMNLTIHIIFKGQTSLYHNYSTKYQRWYQDSRQQLFQLIHYAKSQREDILNSILKISMEIEKNIWMKIIKGKFLNLYAIEENTCLVYYHSGGRYFRKCISKKLSNEYKPLLIPLKSKYQFISILSSNIYYWYWLVVSDDYHVTKNDTNYFPVIPNAVSDENLSNFGKQFLTDLERYAQIINRNRSGGIKQIEKSYKISKSKPIIDEIDKVLAKHYGFTEEELDFIINYDIKYRMGKELNN